MHALHESKESYHLTHKRISKEQAFLHNWSFRAGAASSLSVHPILQHHFRMIHTLNSHEMKYVETKVTTGIFRRDSNQTRPNN